MTYTFIGKTPWRAQIKVFWHSPRPLQVVQKPVISGPVHFPRYDLQPVFISCPLYFPPSPASAVTSHTSPLRSSYFPSWIAAPSSGYCSRCTQRLSSSHFLTIAKSTPSQWVIVLASILGPVCQVTTSPAVVNQTGGRAYILALISVDKKYK